MTVQAERAESRFFGLRSTISTRVLDYRSWIRRESSMRTFSKGPDTVLLRMGNLRLPLSDPHIFATPISEHEVTVHKSDKSKPVTYTKREINGADLITVDGGRVTWRETQPGDYPPLGPDQVETHQVAYLDSSED